MTLDEVLERLSFGIELVAVLLLTIGALRFVVAVAPGVIRGGMEGTHAMQRARVKLGAYILAALEFLIVADIIFTVVHRTLDDVLVLALVAAVRTLISVFLNKEVRELQEREREA